MKDKTKMTIALIVLFVSILVIGSLICFMIFNKNDKILTTNNKNIALNNPNYSQDTSNDFSLGKVMINDITLTGVTGDNYARITIEFLDKDNKVITDDAVLTEIKKLIYYDTSYDVNGTLVTPNLVKTSTYTKDEISNLIVNQKINSLYNVSSFDYDYERSVNGKLVFNYKDILHEGEKKILFTNIVIPTDNGNVSSFKVKAYAEGISTSKFSSRDDALKAMDGE